MEYTRVWWTADNLRSSSPFQPSTRDDLIAHFEAKREESLCDWDRWCCENYTNEETGRASLVANRNCESVKNELLRSFPQLSTVENCPANPGLIPIPPELTPAEIAKKERQNWFRDRAALFYCAVTITIELMLLQFIAIWLAGWWK